jgi:serine/threonine protein kinase/tetratricopeptide (TPR) repeat protein
MAENAPTIPADAARHPPPEQIGAYRILDKLGEGGMGIVYKAEQRQPIRRVVALKVIKLGMDTREVVARFEAERQALALLSHPNVAGVLDAGVTPDTGRPFFAMEFVAGVPLREYCDQNKLTVRERLELFIPVCQAIQHAHQKGIIHRDLKPSNILVSMFDGKPVPKVIDFGIAKAVNHHLAQHTLYTHAGSMIGTPEYMSPEQAMTSGMDVDTRTDIYSLGVILFELLTGTLPFDPQTLRKAGLEGMARIIRETEPPRPSTRLTMIGRRAGKSGSGSGGDFGSASGGGSSGGTGAGTGGTDSGDPATLHRTDPRTLRRQIRGDLDWITLKAMEKDRTRRYETANGLAVDLRRYLDDEPVSACPPSAAYRTTKFIRKHKLGVAAIAAVGLALVLGVVGTTIGLLRARHSRDAAIEARAESDRQRAAAELARDDANAATRFLRDVLISIFSQASDAHGRMAPAIKRLDDGWLTNQPETAIGCRLILGFALMGSNQSESERQFNVGLDLARTSGAAERLPELTASLYEGLAYVCQQRRDLPGAEKYLRLATADFQRFRAPSIEQAYAYENLASVLDHQSRADEARAARMDALAAFLKAKSADIAIAPADANNYQARGQYLARAGKFKEAMPDFARATTLGTDHWSWYYLAILQLYFGDEGAYRTTAEDMLKRFGNSTKPEERDRTAKVCALLPKVAGGDVAQLTRMVDYALASNASAGMLNWFQVAKGMVEFRAERFEPALAALEHVRSLSAPAEATGEFITAMIYQRQGRAQDAKEMLDRAENRAKKLPRRPGEDDLADDAENYLIMEVIRREAEGALMADRK